jgi:Bacterial Ig-like domain (group 3)/IPT/TIG domain
MGVLISRQRSLPRWHIVLGLVAMVIAAGLASIPAQARFVQQGAKLVGSGAVGAADQGSSVAVSADGNTLIFGGYTDNSNAGAVWVFIRDRNGVWTQQGTKLVGSGAVGNAEQGRSVALSEDGNTAIVGGTADNAQAGAGWVFVRKNGVWSQQGSKLVGTGAVGKANQGHSVALSANGNTAIVGGSGDNNFAGATWVFVRSGGVWTQQGNKLVGSGAAGLFQGVSVALSANGNTAIVGGLGDNGNAGAAWVFIRSGGVWTQQGNKLVGTGAVGKAQQGSSVALSEDGNTTIVGGHADNSNAGAAWVFIRSGGVWTQQGNKLVGTGAADPAVQGSSVALSGDGNTAVVGGSNDSTGVGAVWAFGRKSNGVWAQQGNKMLGSGAIGKAAQGVSVALSSDGNTVIVGGSGDNTFAGAAWAFGRPGIAEISPNVGTVLGGTGLTIFGTNLINVTGITFAGVAATDVTPVDTDTVLATTPSHAAGKVNVFLTTTTGTAVLTRGYTYVAQPTFTFLSSSLNPSTAGQRVRFTASVSGVGQVARGKVTFKDGTQTLGTVNLKNGAASFSTKALAAGTHTIRAFFLRNGMFAPSHGTVRQKVN